MKIAIIDTLGLQYDGSTLSKQGLGGSESAVIYISTELCKLGHTVHVYNNCSFSGYYESVQYIDHSIGPVENDYDIVICSRSTKPFWSDSQYAKMCFAARKRILWMHDTFCEGEAALEDMLVRGFIDEVFTLSDFHSWYFSSCDHGNRRNFEVLKHKFWQTRNGAKKYIDNVDLSKKDKNHFVYNASATKGLEPLLNKIWPRIKTELPNAHLTCIGGFYRFADKEPDEQERTVHSFIQQKIPGVTFTGVISQAEIANILTNAYMMLYPTAFPETFGISSLESLLYKTPIVTNRFGALEETALDSCCYKINYSSTNNALFNNIDEEEQANRFVNTVLNAYNDDYKHYQKQNACSIVNDITDWSTVALQWDQHFYTLLNIPYPVEKYRKVTEINESVARVFNRRFNNIEDRRRYSDFSYERKISIISPFYNASNYIVGNILSVAQQDYSNYKHILIDDASTDNSYEIAKQTIESLPLDLQKRFVLYKNKENIGAIGNQVNTFNKNVGHTDIVMLLDGDDKLVCNNTLFKFYNNLYHKGYDFTYGSMHSIADNISLQAQSYNTDEKYPWDIPYTHLRTFSGNIAHNINKNNYIKDGKWLKAGADNPLFRETYSLAKKPKHISEIVVEYNDINPINDYKVNRVAQNKGASTIISNKKVLIAVPTNKYVETETLKSIYDLQIPNNVSTELQFFYGYQVDQIRNLIADWGKRYDYVLHVDSDIVLPKNALEKLISADKPIVSGLYIQRKSDQHILEIYNEHGNIPVEQLTDNLTKITACGFGCCLVKGEVYRKVSYPHFKYTSAIDHKNTVSEDWYFCNKAKQHGFNTWVDPTLVCSHIGQQHFNVVKPTLTHLDRVAQADLLPIEHTNYLQSMNIKPKIIYDLGACVLHWTRKAKDIWPTASFYLVDAAHSVDKYLNSSGYSYSIEVLSDVDNKELVFYEDPENPGGNSYYLETTGAFTEKHATKRRTKRLDTLVSEKGWPPPDLIKLDIQGAELDVLKGAGTLLNSCKDIILEAQHVEYNKNAPKIEDIKQYLYNSGFSLVSNFTKTAVDGDYHFTRISALSE